MTVAISMMRCSSGLSPVISRSIQIRLSLRFTWAPERRMQCGSTQGTFQRSTAEHVQMCMKYHLPTLAIDVHGHTVAGQSMLAGETLRRQQQAADELAVLVREVVQRRDVRFGNHEAMERRLGVNVLEGQDALVLVDSLGGELTRDDLAKQARWVRRHHRPPSPAESISRRPLSARARVPPSMYSSSPPTGTP